MATASVDNVKDGLQTVLDWANSQGWTTCTGTVVASDLTPLSSAITTLEGKPGLDCIGNVVGLINNGTDITPDADGKVTLNTPVYTLSGSTLTITF